MDKIKKYYIECKCKQFRIPGTSNLPSKLSKSSPKSCTCRRPLPRSSPGVVLPLSPGGDGGVSQRIINEGGRPVASSVPPPVRGTRAIDPAFTYFNNKLVSVTDVNFIDLSL
jgi:hypothetical protein